MGEYSANDIVIINGTKQRITSYPPPSDGARFMTTVSHASDGGDIQNTYNVDDPQLVIELLEKGEEPGSTAGEVPDIEPAPAAPDLMAALKASVESAKAQRARKAAAK